MLNSEKNIHSSFWRNVFKNSPDKFELAETLNTIPPFCDLKKSLFLQVINQLHNRNYIAGEYIFMQSDPGIGMYIIAEGEVKIEYITPKNNKVILAEFTKGDFFGELALLDGEKRSASAVAKTDCKIAVLFKPDLDELIYKNPKDGINILSGITKIVTTRLRNLNHDYLLLQDKLFELEEN